MSKYLIVLLLLCGFCTANAQTYGTIHALPWASTRFGSDALLGAGVGVEGYLSNHTALRLGLAREQLAITTGEGDQVRQNNSREMVAELNLRYYLPVYKSVQVVGGAGVQYAAIASEFGGIAEVGVAIWKIRLLGYANGGDIVRVFSKKKSTGSWSNLGLRVELAL